MESTRIFIKTNKWSQSQFGLTIYLFSKLGGNSRNLSGIWKYCALHEHRRSSNADNQIENVHRRIGGNRERHYCPLIRRFRSREFYVSLMNCEEPSSPPNPNVKCFVPVKHPRDEQLGDLLFRGWPQQPNENWMVSPIKLIWTRQQRVFRKAPRSVNKLMDWPTVVEGVKSPEVQWPFLHRLFVRSIFAELVRTLGPAGGGEGFVNFVPYLLYVIVDWHWQVFKT